MVVFAHAGHWLLQLIYVAPLVVFAVMLVRARMQQRRERRAGPHGES